MKKNEITSITSGGSKFNLIKFIRKNIVFVALVVVITFFGFTANNFFTLQNFLNIGRQTAIISIISCGMTYLVISGNIDLSVGSVLALSAMIGALVIQESGIIILGIISALAIGTLVGFTNGVLTTKAKIPAFLVTLGMMGIARGIAMLLTNTRPIIIYKEMYWRLFGEGTIGGVFPAPVIWTIVVVVISHIFLKYSKFGRTVYATGGNATSARYTGLNTDRIIISVFMITGFLSAFAGIVLSSRMHTAWPNVANLTVIDVFAAVILGGTSLFGGRGTILGSLLGSIVIGTVNNGLTMLGYSSHVQMLVRSTIIILAVIFAARQDE